MYRAALDDQTTKLCHVARVSASEQGYGASYALGYLTGMMGDLLNQLDLTSEQMSIVSQFVERKTTAANIPT